MIGARVSLKIVKNIWNGYRTITKEKGNCGILCFLNCTQEFDHVEMRPLNVLAFSNSLFLWCREGKQIEKDFEHEHEHEISTVNRRTHTHMFHINRFNGFEWIII